MKKLSPAEDIKAELESLIAQAEEKAQDDAESIITNERYLAITDILKYILIRKDPERETASDRIDKVLTSRLFALPIFFLIMWGVYYISIQTVGSWTIDGIQGLVAALSGGVETLMTAAGVSQWLVSLVVNGVIEGVGAVLVFVPQIMILYFFISILEDCGYMARVAFIMDRIFRRIGLSGKSFIPMLIGTGCSVPAIMASRTIENENDRRMTIILTPFIPCGAKIPVFAMFAALLFSKQSWVGPSMYLVGIVMAIVSGLILKKTRLFSKDVSPFVMELPDYKLPSPKSVMIHMWEKGKEFVIRAGTLIFPACVLIWFLRSFSPAFLYLSAEQIDQSILAKVGGFISPLFIPLGFGNWASSIALLTGVMAKEVIVATFSLMAAGTQIVFTQVTAYAFMVFTLLSAPCVAAIGAIRREMNSFKWTMIAIGYQMGLAYVMAMAVNLIGGLLFPDAAKVILSGDLASSQAQEAASSGIFGNPLSIMIIAALIILAIALAIRTVKNRAGGGKEPM